MRAEAASHLRHPTHGTRLSLEVEEEVDGDVLSGALVSGDERFPIVRGIPRFCAEENYANTFGFQWNTYSTTQLDSVSSWDSASTKRLFRESGWPRDLNGQRVLEAGCGMGRFTEVLAKAGASVCTFDYSTAVEASSDNCKAFENVCFSQANVYEPPYEHASFDKVMCIGVLQHCPSPRDAFMSLTRFVKPGGEIFIDVYRLSFRSLFLGKYYLRPITRRISVPTLHRLVRFHVGWLYPFTGLVQRVAGSAGRSLSWALAMADYRGVYDADEETLRNFALLDTFDMLAPAYDRPKTFRSVRRWFDDAGFVDVKLAPGDNGIAATGRRPA